MLLKAEAWLEHLQNITLRVDDTSIMTTHDRTTLLMETISEVDEQQLFDETQQTSSPNTTSIAIDREQNDIIKVKNVCKCR